jgi:hypothetical protein
MRKTTKQSTGICWNFTTKLNDLDFADDLALISSKQTDLQDKSSQLESTAAQVGLKGNCKENKSNAPQHTKHTENKNARGIPVILAGI